jgi:rifampicin phosphotransferase
MTTLLASTATRLGALDGADEPRAGGKAANCARLLRAGFPAPDGLVVLAGSSGDDIAALPSHPWFDEQPAGARFAVRSSGIGEDGAGQSFAGVHRTELDVRREDLSAAVADCLASAHDAQALDYRRAKGLPTDTIAMGVLIQPMVSARVSGVAFTLNPVTGDAGEVVINASWGLGEALVSGQVDPDEFVVRKADRYVQWSRLGDKGEGGTPPVAALDPAQLAELVRLVTRIEQHYGAAQDVEWCHDGATFWIVQSRPVTTATAAAGPDIEWTRANLAEVFPDITSPQALDAFDDLLNEAERRYLGRLMAPECEAGPMAKAFHGRLCFNLTQLRHVTAAGGVAPAAMLRSMGHAGAIRPEDEVAPKARLPLAALPDVARILWQHLHPEAVIRAHHRRTAEALQRLRADDLRQLEDVDLWAPIERWHGEAAEFLQTVLLLGNVLFHEQRVHKACAAVGHSAESLIYPHLAAGERSVSAQQAFDLVALADLARRDAPTAAYLRQHTPDLADARRTLAGTPFLAAFERFLAAYGHRGHYEYDWSLPRYVEDAAPIFQALKVHLDAPAVSAPAPSASADSAAAEAWAAFAARLSRWQRWTMAPAVRRALTRVKQYYVWRERVRSDIARLVGIVRARHLILAERFVRRGWIAAPADYFMLHLREVAEVITGTRASASLAALVAARATEQERWRKVQVPHLLRESALPTLLRMTHVTGGADGDGTLTGHAVSPGCVEAEVVVVRDPADFGRMRRGAILVAPATDPSWTPLFTLASGVIVEIGGVLSHASTIAREYGLPALANVRHATRRLRTGDRVRLDADAGVVQRIVNTPAVDGGQS